MRIARRAALAAVTAALAAPGVAAAAPAFVPGVEAAPPGSRTTPSAVVDAAGATVAVWDTAWGRDVARGERHPPAGRGLRAAVGGLAGGRGDRPARDRRRRCLADARARVAQADVGHVVCHPGFGQAARRRVRRAAHGVGRRPLRTLAAALQDGRRRSAAHLPRGGGARLGAERGHPVRRVRRRGGIRRRADPRHGLEPVCREGGAR